MFSVTTFGQELNADTTFTEYHEGLLWKYIKHNGTIIGSTCYKSRDKYGKYYQLRIFIYNESNDFFVFHPEYISATITTKRNRVKSLLVYSYDKYMRKIEHKQKWSMALNEFAVGFNSGMAAHKSAHVRGWSPRTVFYSGTVNYYDYGAAISSNIQGAMYLDDLQERYDEDRVIKSRGYLKICTIRPVEYIIGYINIKRKSGKLLNVSIPVNNKVYNFCWNLQERY